MVKCAVCQREEHHDFIFRGEFSVPYCPEHAPTKLVIAINGSGGVGKDTVCNIAGTAYEVCNRSSITPIKEIAKKYGNWNGQKDAKSRKFLSDLKLIFSEYCDLSFIYIIEETFDFMHNPANDIMFVHIREPQEIQKYMNTLKAVNIPCISLLVTSDKQHKWNNMADDNVNNYNYDYVFHNNCSLKELPERFLKFFNDIIKDRYEYRKVISR